MYLVVLTLAPTLQTALDDIRRELDAEKAARQPAHITLLPPFGWNGQGGEAELTDYLRNFAHSQISFEMLLKGVYIDFPESDLIVLRVEPQETLGRLAIDAGRPLRNRMDQEGQTNYDTLTGCPFLGHITIGCRSKLSKDQNLIQRLDHLFRCFPSLAYSLSLWKKAEGCWSTVRGFPFGGSCT